jgi:uncharacterized protein DUF2817
MHKREIGSLLRAAEKHQAKIETYPWSDVGPQGENLCVYCLHVGPPDARKRLIISAGTHGIEGRAGVRVMTQTLSQLRLPENSEIAALFIAPVNPYGFAHRLRVDQHNVDVNRGCLVSKQKPDDSAFTSLLNEIRPSSWDEDTLSSLRHTMQTRLREIASAVAVGQYSYPDAIFYGGEGLCESGKILKTIADRLNEAGVTAVAMLDLHTGLGPYAKGELLSTTDDAGMRKRLESCVGLCVQFVNLDTTAAYQVRGSVLTAMEAWLNCREASIFTALEMGPKSEAYQFLIAENFIRHNPGVLPAAIESEIRRQFEYLFFPSGDRLWEGALRARTINVVDQMIAYLQRT